MRVFVFELPSAAKAAASELLLQQINVKPTSILGLATGGTMEGVYDMLVEHHRAGRCSFAHARSFNLDEYLGLSGWDPQSYRRYMEERLFRHVDMRADRIHSPMGDASDPYDEADRYEKAIVNYGPIDLQLLGLGSNGHIGFNEPSSEFASQTRVVDLSRSTIEANGRFFGQDEHQPTQALTMGIATIMKARRIVLLAVGQSKSKAVAQTVEGETSTCWPSTVLRSHQNVTMLIDRAAAGDLTMLDRYEQVSGSS